MNIQKSMAIHFFFPEGIRPAVILYTTLWDAYLNEYLYFFLWELYLAKTPQQMLSLFQMQVSVLNQQPAVKVPGLSLFLARQAGNHSLRAKLAGGSHGGPYSSNTAPVFHDRSTHTHTESQAPRGTSTCTQSNSQSKPLG